MRETILLRTPLSASLMIYLVKEGDNHHFRVVTKSSRRTLSVIPIDSSEDAHNLFNEMTGKFLPESILKKD